MKKLTIFILLVTIFGYIKNINAKVDIENKKYKINAVKFLIDPEYKVKGGAKKFMTEAIEIKKSEIAYTIEQINNKTIKMNKIMEELEILNKYKRKLDADLRNYLHLMEDL